MKEVLYTVFFALGLVYTNVVLAETVQQNFQVKQDDDIEVTIKVNNEKRTIKVKAADDIRIAFSKANAESEQKKDCLSEFGKTKCGYGCIAAYGRIECGTKPGMKCKDGYGKIACGYDCKAEFGKVMCSEDPNGTCQAAYGKITCTGK